MGYTHYWKSSEFSHEQWALIKEAAQKLIAAPDAPKVVFDFGEEDKPPHISDVMIRFNGPSEEGHETFLMYRSSNRDFCKTARKPYDDVVVCLLAVAKQVAPNVITVSSDGYREDWDAGLSWGSKVLGTELKYPVEQDNE
jgi:hypothetical protein